jgi:5S rRNA maturation endonuclease (ribonuclease M5)
VGNRFQGRCPIHHGDNDTAFCYYKETNVWRCFTHLCHDRWGSGPQGLARALQIDCDALSMPAPLLPPDIIERAPESLTRVAERAGLNARYEEFPSTYFIKRGFDPAILKLYDVGTCLNPEKPFYKRAVVPCYDMDDRYVVGFSGRDIAERGKNKWKHSYGFKKSHYLYNLWRQHKNIREKGRVLLVEGFGDVWKLEEAGIPCSLAIMGTALSLPQRSLLSELGVMDIFLLLDRDEPGKNAALTIYNQNKLLYNVNIVELDYNKDIGEMSAPWLRKNLSFLSK